MENKEETMRLSEDPRFIKHIRQQLVAYGAEINRIEKEIAKAGLHRKRGGYDRLFGAGLTDSKALAGEFERVLARTSIQPATIRMTVAAIGHRALSSYAHELAEEGKEEKK